MSFISLSFGEAVEAVAEAQTTEKQTKGEMMLKLTENAKKKIEGLKSQASDPELAVRVVSSTSTQSGVSFSWDKEKQGDQTVKDDKGSNVLLVGADVAPSLEGMVMDYQVTPQGEGFTISKLNPTA